MGESGPLWVPFNFLAIPEEDSQLETAKVVVVPVPYDSTTSFKGGAREGPRAIIEASYNLEDYDPELDLDVAKLGIYTAPWLEPHMEGPRHMIDRVRDGVCTFLRQGKMVALLGGEHSISTGHVKALVEGYSDPWGSQGLSVLYLDAHADMRDEYMGTGLGTRLGGAENLRAMPCGTGGGTKPQPGREAVHRQQQRQHLSLLIHDPR